MPAVADIRTAKDALSQRNAERVVAFSSDIVVRYGTASKEREGQTLLFLESQLQGLPVPKLLVMFREGEELFIVIERIQGRRLDTLWSMMSDSEKTSILASLKQSMTRIRSLRGHFFDSVDQGALPHHLFCNAENDPARSGHFNKEDDLNQGLLLLYRDIQKMNGYPEYKSTFYESAFASVLKNHMPVFTHSDIQTKNIIIKRTAASETSIPTMIAHLVDWEDAGWYPEYWEYFVYSTHSSGQMTGVRRPPSFLICGPQKLRL